MGKSKTRVTVKYDGELRLLFSIRELNDQSLLAILNSEANVEDPRKESDIGIIEHRISAHVSPNSPGTTIKRTMTLEDGREITSALFVKNSKDRLLTHLMHRLSPVLSGRYTRRLAPRDRVVNVCALSSTDRATLIYGVFLADHQTTLPTIAGHGLTVIKFKRWQIGVYSTLLDFPETPFGRFLSLATSPERESGVAAAPPLTDGAESLDPSSLGDFMLSLDNRVAATLIRQLADRAPEAEDYLLNVRLWFHANRDDLALARLQRAVQSI